VGPTFPISGFLRLRTSELPEEEANTPRIDPGTLTKALLIGRLQ